MRLISGIMIFLCAVSFTAWYKIYQSPQVKEVREFKAVVSKIDLGTDKKTVLQLLGNPNDQSDKFQLAQVEGYAAAYQRAARSKSKYYMYWFKGIDHVFAVGFDKDHKVTIIENGGT